LRVDADYQCENYLLMHPRLKDSRMFLCYFPMNKAIEISSFQEKQTKIRNQYTVKKTDRESFFLFWITTITGCFEHTGNLQAG